MLTWVPSILTLLKLLLLFIVLLTGPELTILLFDMYRLWGSQADADFWFLLTVLLLRSSLLFTGGRVREVWEM